MASYIVKTDAIEHNVKAIKKAFAEEGLDLMLSYSLKTNSMPSVLRKMHECKVAPEVVSEMESDLADKYFPHRRKVSNGVATSYEKLAELVQRRHLVNVNDLESLKRVYEITGDGYPIGLRVRFDDKSRFGIRSDDLHEALEFCKGKYWIECIHCHVTGTREKSKYEAKVSAMVDTIKANRVTPKYIDLGGSMYGEMHPRLRERFADVTDFKGYARIIAAQIERLNYKPSVILECGTALIANAVNLRANVIRVDEYDRVVLDCDKYTIGMLYGCDIPYRCNCNGEEGEYNIYGCSCIEDDLLIRHKGPRPKVGDEFEFIGCGAYTYCFEPEFIIPRAEVLEE